MSAPEKALQNQEITASVSALDTASDLEESGLFLPSRLNAQKGGLALEAARERIWAWTWGRRWW